MDRAYRRLDFSHTSLGNAHLDHMGFIRPEREPGKLFRTMGSWFEQDVLPPPPKRYHEKTESSFTWPYGQGITKVYPGSSEDRYGLGPICVDRAVPFVPPNGPAPNFGMYARRQHGGQGQLLAEGPGGGNPNAADSAGQGGSTIPRRASPRLAPHSILTPADQPYMRMSSYLFPRHRGSRRRPEWLAQHRGGDPPDNEFEEMSLNTIFCPKRPSAGVPLPTRTGPDLVPLGKEKDAARKGRGNEPGGAKGFDMRCTRA